MSDCLNPDWSPSYGYQQGCRCDKCRGWRRAKDLEHRETLNARRRERRRVGWSQPEPRPAARTSDRSTTTFYNDILDWWDGL